MRLFRQFILRRMLQEKARTVTTIVGVALGIAVVIAIQLTNGSSVRGFETALTTVAGRTSIEVVGTGGVPESVLADLGFLRDIGQMSPVIEGEMALVTSDLPRGDSGVVAPVRRSEAVRVLGVDILRDLTLRDYAMAERQQEGSSPAEALSRW